jgi:hypothetical protein
MLNPMPLNIGAVPCLWPDGSISLLRIYFSAEKLPPRYFLCGNADLNIGFTVEYH